MDFATYLRAIRFRFLRPAARRPHGLRRLSMLLRRVGVELEMANTRLPFEAAAMRRRLRRACRMPRMSTFAIGAVINRAVAAMPHGAAFVNVGVWNGFTFLCGLAGHDGRRCIGVDNFSHRNSPREAFLTRLERHGGPRHEFYEMDFREYFATVHTGPIGVYVFDGPHRYTDHLDALRLAEPFFTQGCIVIIDDSNWPDVRRGTFDAVRTSGGRYESLLDVRTPGSGHPTFWNGLLVLRYGGAAVSRDFFAGCMEPASVRREPRSQNPAPNPVCSASPAVESGLQIVNCKLPIAN